MYESGVALGGLACFITPDLARDLASDIVNLVGHLILTIPPLFQLSSSRPYTRKRAVLLLYKVFLKYPDALRPTFPRLKEKLEDPDPGRSSSIKEDSCRCTKCRGERNLRIGEENPKELSDTGAGFLQIDDDVEQQLDAH